MVVITAPRPVIREAGPADIPAILQLYVAAGITATSAFSVPEAQRQLEVFSRYPFYKVFVAVFQEKVVGTYELVLLDNLAKAGAMSAVVEDVAVDPTVHKKGVGRAMMAHAMEIARAQGAYKLALSSNLRRQDAHAFYEALGFRRHGVSFLVEL